MERVIRRVSTSFAIANVKQPSVFLLTTVFFPTVFRFVVGIVVIKARKTLLTVSGVLNT